ncbi:hypothetical protein C6P44_001677 [Monosporozyma unispora]|nr:hypothetical protein C6P44_001677 [Kazachstania unispora]
MDQRPLSILNQRHLSGSPQNYGSTSQNVLPNTQSTNSFGNQSDSVFESSENFSVQDETFNTISRYDMLAYYLPCSSWIGEYSWIKFLHDFIAGLSLASFQIPLSISYATSLAHTDPLSGLYSLGITPFVYAIFGSVPSMIVGPEAAISLVIGQTVETLVAHREDITSIQIITVTTFLAGLSLLIIGILRLGFLGTILSRALLRGFISSVGFVMIFNSLIIVGEFSGQGFDHLKNPVSTDNRPMFSLLGQLSVITATLGFFESITASKALGGIDNSIVSSNRELIALGLMNMVGSTFGVLPSFGGYVITTLVGLTLLEDIPQDILFHIRCHGFNELIVFLLTVITTLFYSVELGICVGCLYSVITIIKHSAKSRIQILTKVEGINKFINVDDYMHFYEEGHVTVEQDLKERLDRVKRFGTPNAHPGSKEIARENIDYVIFDLHGMTFLDSSAAQILYEIVKAYQEDGTFVFLARVPRKNDIRRLLKESGILELLEFNINRVMKMLYNRTTANALYFRSVEDALVMVGRIKQEPHEYGQMGDNSSVMSKTLMNSNLV